MLWFNYFCITALLVSLSAKYISPQLFWFLAFFGLAFPFLVLVNLFFVIYWTIQFRIAALFSFSALIGSLFTIGSFVQFSFPEKTTNKDIKVTSYNSMLFDLYNWRKNAETRKNILNSLIEINPDILCLQEFYTSEEENDFHNIDTVVQLLKTKNYHVEYTVTQREFDHWGIATFCKYPIVNKGKIVFNTRSNNICIYTDVLINKDTVRIYNIHLQSIHFSKSEHRFITDLKSGNDAKDEYENSKSIIKRLKKAFIKRAEQTEKIAEHIKNCSYKIILCGDFNDTPASHTYNLINQKLKDTFVEKGNGIGVTYAGNFPRFRIDYIFHSKEFKCKLYERSHETYTDHYPITTCLEIPD